MFFLFPVRSSKAFYTFTSFFKILIPTTHQLISVVDFG